MSSLTLNLVRSRKVWEIFQHERENLFKATFSTRRWFCNVTNSLYFLCEGESIYFPYWSNAMAQHESKDRKKSRKENLLAQSQTFISKLHETQNFNEKYLLHSENKYHIDWISTKSERRKIEKINDTPRSSGKKFFLFFFFLKNVFSSFINLLWINFSYTKPNIYPSDKWKAKNFLNCLWIHSSSIQGTEKRRWAKKKFYSKTNKPLAIIEILFLFEL